MLRYVYNVYIYIYIYKFEIYIYTKQTRGWEHGISRGDKKIMLNLDFGLGISNKCNKMLRNFQGKTFICLPNPVWGIAQ